MTITIYPIFPTSKPLGTTILLCYYEPDLFCFFNIPLVSDIMQYLAFSAWLISLSIIFVYVAANGRISFFLWVNNIPVCVCVCVCVCVFYSFFNQQNLHCFHTLTIVNSAASKHKGMEIQIFLQDNDFISFG